MSDWSEVITWLIGGGTVAAVSWFVSWFLEPLAWWQALRSQVRKLIILGVSIGIGMVATFLAGLPPEELAPYLPYLNTFILAVVAWLGSQVAHRADSRAQ